MRKLFSRRSLLRTGGGFALGAPFLMLNSRQALAAPVDNLVTPPITKMRRPFARVMAAGVVIRSAPSVNAKQVRVAKWNEVLTVLGQTESDTSPVRHNKTWYQTPDGFAHSLNLQPVENAPQTPESAVPSGGFWAETSVPMTFGRGSPVPDGGALFRMPFGTVFQVLEVLEGADAKPWYRISDGRSEKIFAPAINLRRLSDVEFAPISPNVAPKDKRLEVDLRKQEMIAFENDVEVFRARCATGAFFKLEDGTQQDFTTTPGDYTIYEKRPSRRMSGGEQGSGDYYDLPGIPWVSYFTRSRIAFHGAYWHNDFGRPRSHGCVNLLPEDANWVYRWSLPVAPSVDALIKTQTRDQGTRVLVY
jgi:hypothetical protein